MKMYYWNQNNSGGSFDIDDQLAPWVFIQASSLDEAEERAVDMGIYYDGVRAGADCPCCGDRWYEPDELKFPMKYGDRVFRDVKEYAQHLANEYSFRDSQPAARIFWKNGKVAEINRKEIAK